jgi:hypothetical protein
VTAHRTEPLLVVDLTGAPPERRERLAQLALLQATQEPFDLDHGPLVRAVFARLGPEEHACLITAHHLVTDWIAYHIFWSELAALYDAALNGRPSPLAELPVQYVDYSVWQRQWLQGEALEELAGYWRNKLSSFPLVLDLPTDRPRRPDRRMKGGRYIVETGPEPADRLRSLARREGATMFMATFAVVNALLQRFTGQQKMVLGSNNANRNRPEIEQIIGYFLIPVAFAVDMTGDPTFRELLGRVRATALEAYLYQDMPFAKLLEAVNPEPRPGMPAIFQSLVLVLDSQYNKSRMEGVQGDVFFLYDAGARYDIMFGLYDTPMGIFGPVEYDYSLFDFSTIARLMELFYRIVASSKRSAAIPSCGCPSSRPSRRSPGVRCSPARTRRRLRSSSALPGSPRCCAGAASGWATGSGSSSSRRRRSPRWRGRPGGWTRSPCPSIPASLCTA